ncbi:sulfurtransferase [Synergistales bacterium]|nr:sulfurtransferase [Synergistales bacterium]GHV52927.1 sulfurtransferase [Synergistales bacterium]
MKRNNLFAKLLLVTALIVSFAGSAMAAASAAPKAAAPAAPQPSAPFTETYKSLFVTPEWLKANIGSVVLIDARAQSLYKGQQGHLPGAVNAEWTYFANMGGKAGDPNWGDITDPAVVAKRIGALGVDGKKEVIVYGDGGDWGNAGWVVWIFRTTGFNNAKILDGGFSAWKASGGKTSNTTHANKAAAYPHNKFDPAYNVSTEWLASNIDNPNLTIVDVRSEKEYTGEIRPFGEARPGHIPGAINFDMSNVFTPDFRVHSEEKMQEVLLSAGFTDKDREIILYDTAGVRSAFTTMIFRVCGYKNARNYDSAYHAWSANKNLEIRQGPNP